jgi:hypothetical protein
MKELRQELWDKGLLEKRVSKPIYLSPTPAQIERAVQSVNAAKDRFRNGV